MISPCCQKETGFGTQDYQSCPVCKKWFKKGDKKKVDPQVEQLMKIFHMTP